MAGQIQNGLIANYRFQVSDAVIVDVDSRANALEYIVQNNTSPTDDGQASGEADFIEHITNGSLNSLSPLFVISAVLYVQQTKKIYLLRIIFGLQTFALNNNFIFIFFHLYLPRLRVRQKWLR